MPGAILAAATIMAWLDRGVPTAWRYDRAAIAGGEWWRLLSGHLAHLGWSHLVLNGVGLLLVWLLIGHCVSALAWLAVIVAIIAGIDVAFWFLDPQLQWYVGLSGALHGLLVFGLLRDWRAARWEHALLLIGVLGKLVYEQAVGPLPGSTSASNGPVVVNAHLYGAVAGALVAGAAAVIRVRGSRPI